MTTPLQEQVQKAQAGDPQALEAVVLHIKDLVYNLALRMLLFPEDAKDASQEIIIKVITHLSTFQAKSNFKTWVYRIAANYLLTIKGKKSTQFAMPFEDYEQLIDNGQSNQINYTDNAGEQRLLEEELAPIRYRHPDH